MTMLDRVVAVTGIVETSPLSWVNGFVIGVVIIFSVQVVLALLDMGGFRRV